MTENILFWKKWKPLEKILFVLLSLLLLVVFCGSVMFWWNGNSNILDWNTISELKHFLAPADSFSDGILTLTTNESIYYVKEYYLPSGVAVYQNVAYAFVAVLLLGISLVLSALLQQKSSWFLLAIVLLGAILLSFRLEIIFNHTHQAAFLLSFFLVAGVAYYFNSWSKRTNATFTFPVFVVLFALFIGVLLYLGIQPKPLLAAANYGLLTCVGVLLIFVFFVSHEILAALVVILTSNTVQKKNQLRPFLVAGGIYLLNILLVYLENSQRIEGNGVIIAPVFLYGISLFLGFWGTRRFFQQTEQMSFQQSGVWLYLGGAFISTATLGYLYATANDSLIEFVEDYIAIAHLVVGVVFFVHLIINFWQPFQQGLAVHKVIYKPVRSKLILARLVAVFGIVLVFSLKSYFSVQQLLAGNNNAIADYHLAIGDLPVAEAYYKQSLSLEPLNFKANYSLASLANSQGNLVNAGFYFKQATLKKANDYAYIGLSQSLIQEDLFFDGLFILQEAARKLPKNARIQTNLGYLFDKTKALDSSFVYRTKALEHCQECGVERANLLAFWLENAKINKLDSVQNAIPTNNYLSAKANASAIKKRLATKAEKQRDFLPSDSLLGVAAFAQLFNEVTNLKNDRNFTEKALKSIQLKTENAGFYDDLLYARAKQNYYFGDKRQAIQQLAYLAADSTKNIHATASTLGIWLLQEGVYNKALPYFKKVGDEATLQKLQETAFVEGIEDRQLQEATEATKQPITLENYDKLLQKAPFNPFLIEKIATFLLTQKQPEKAYQLVFDAVQVNDKNARLWQLYSLLSLQIGLKDYAEDGLQQVKSLITGASLDAFVLKYEEQKRIRQESDKGF